MPRLTDTQALVDRKLLPYKALQPLRRDVTVLLQEDDSPNRAIERLLDEIIVKQCQLSPNS